jgi:hypothetical protein
MSNSAVQSRKLKRDRAAHAADGKQKSSRGFSVGGAIKFALAGLLGMFGFGKSKAGIAAVYKPVSFTTPTHSPYLCGRRTPEERAQRKACRQKRTRLIMTRGFA